MFLVQRISTDYIKYILLRNVPAIFIFLLLGLFAFFLGVGVFLVRKKLRNSVVVCSAPGTGIVKTVDLIYSQAADAAFGKSLPSSVTTLHKKLT